MDFVNEVKQKYSYLSNAEATMFVNKAKSILVEYQFPSDESISYDTYIIPARYDMWILDCVDELIERNGVSSLTAYKENGVSMTWSKSGISDGLLQRLTRKVGVVN